MSPMGPPRCRTLLAVASRSAYALASTVVLASLANADTLCTTVTSGPPQKTNWNSSLTIPKFDPALGVLKSIRVDLTGHIQGSARIESHDVAPSTTTVVLEATLSLNRPDGSVLVIAVPRQPFVDNLTPFDGVDDWAGGSGRSHDNITADATESVTSPPPPSDLVLFTGPINNPGTIVLPVTARGTSSASGSGNVISQFITDASAAVTVCYTYALDCNGNQIGDDQDIAGGMADADANGIPDECEPSSGSFCDGDGAANGGIDCPCNNNAPAGSHRGCLHGFGSGAKLEATGTASVSNDTLVLSATQIPASAVAWFYQGTQAANGGDGLLFGNGIKCLAGTIVLPQKIHVGLGGGTFPELGGLTVSGTLGVAPGETRYYQVWFRNNNGPCGAGINTSNGIKVVWGL